MVQIGFKYHKKGEWECLQEKNITLINDSYNASFDSMKAAIKYLAEEVISNRKIVVLGDMFELGDFAEELHRNVGKEVAKNKIDKLFAIGENSKFIVQEAIKTGMPKDDIYYFKTKEDLLESIQDIMEEGDAILFKASNGVKLFELVDKLKEIRLWKN